MPLPAILDRRLWKVLRLSECCWFLFWALSSLFKIWSLLCVQDSSARTLSWFSFGKETDAPGRAENGNAAPADTSVLSRTGTTCFPPRFPLRKPQERSARAGNGRSPRHNTGAELTGFTSSDSSCLVWNEGGFSLWAGCPYLRAAPLISCTPALGLPIVGEDSVSSFWLLVYDNSRAFGRCGGFFTCF